MLELLPEYTIPLTECINCETAVITMSGRMFSAIRTINFPNIDIEFGISWGLSSSAEGLEVRLNGVTVRGAESDAW